MSHNKVFNSYGIGCCRWNIEKKQMEILMVKKRVSYYFLDFVLNKYTHNDISTITNLLSNMTIEEKLILKHMNPKKIWFKAWLEDVDNPNISLMRLRYYHKFETKFRETINKIKEKKFIKLLNQTNHNDNMWEIPKGRKINKNEKNLNCAIREFCEETNYDISKITLLNNKEITAKRFVKNTVYIFNYYIGFTYYNELNTKKPIDKIQEISDVKWLSLNDIKLLNTNESVINAVSSIFSILKSQYNIAKITQINKIILDNDVENKKNNDTVKNNRSDYMKNFKYDKHINNKNDRNDYMKNFNYDENNKYNLLSSNKIIIVD